MLDEKELSPFNVRKDYIFPLYTAAKKWASVLKAPDNNEPVTFRMLYYNVGRTLTQIETILKRAYGNPLPIKSQDRLFRIRHKLEQMVARYKQCENELKAEYQKRKSKES